MAFKSPFFRSAFNYDTDEVSNATGIDFKVIDPDTGELVPELSLTKQSFAEESDINVIVKRFGITGQLPDNVLAPTYADFSDVYDFHSAALAIAQANESFDSLPAQTRARFNNDPAQFVDFCSNQNNYDEAIKLGLVFPNELPAVAESEAGADDLVAKS